MKKIDVVISSFYPRVGGSERQLQLLSEYLIKEGYDVNVVTRRYKGLAKEEKIGNINVNRIKVVKINKLTEKISFYINAILYYIFKVKERPEIIIASQTGVAAAVAIFIKTFFGGKVFIRIAGSELKKYEEEQGVFKKRFKNVDKFIILNNDMKETMYKLKEDRMIKITNAVVKPKSISGVLGNYILYCGRIEEVKGIQLLLETWKEMQKEGFEIPLVIVGDGSLKNELQEKYKSLRNISWVGEISDTQEYYKKAKLLINTSEYEGISNSILEALSYGIPVIASKVGGNIDIIKDDENGLLFERESTSIIRVIIDLYFNDERLESMRKKSLKYIENHYIENIVEEYIKQFDI